MNTKNCVSVRDFEQRAKKVLPSAAFLYFESGADEEVTKEDNIQAFKRIRLKPRLFQSVGEVDLSTSLLGQPVQLPVGISPTSFSKTAWPDGEISVAKAAKSRETCYVVSMGSTTTFEDICNVCPHSLKWFQVYILPDRRVTDRAVRQAATFGVRALVLTVDSPIPGHRRKVMRHPLTLPPHMKRVFLDEINETASSTKGIPVGTVDVTLSWEDIRWLKSISDLPIVVKGILTAEDALLAVKHGASAVWVSNHGGRELDTVPATIDVLPDIVAAVGKQVEVYMDGGIRSGTDVLKALALGARAVFIGRPTVWGLACSGKEGVEQVLDIFKTELNTAMSVSGNTSVQTIEPTIIHRRQNNLSRL